MEATIVYWGYIGIMEKKMETTIVYWVYIGIMEKKMESTMALRYDTLGAPHVSSRHVEEVWNRMQNPCETQAHSEITGCSSSILTRDTVTRKVEQEQLPDSVVVLCKTSILLRSATKKNIHWLCGEGVITRTQPLDVD